MNHPNICSIHYFSEKPSKNVMTVLNDNCSAYVFIYSENYLPSKHNSLIIERSSECRYILFLHDDLLLFRKFVHSYNDNLYHLIISNFKDNEYFGVWYPTIHTAYGSSYSTIIFNREMFIGNINSYTDETKNNLFEYYLKMQSKNFRFKWANQTDVLGQYKDINDATNMFMSITNNCLAHKNYKGEYIVELFRKYNVKSGKDFKEIMTKIYDNYDVDRPIKIRTESLMNYVNTHSAFTTSYTTSKFSLAQSSDMSDYDSKAFIGIDRALVGLSEKEFIPPKGINRKKNWMIAFIYLHNIENNNFERKIFYFYRRLKSYGIQSCVIVPHNIDIPLAYHFDRDDLISGEVGQHITANFIRENNIRKLVLIDGYIGVWREDINRLIHEDNLEVYVIVAGYVSYMSQFLPYKDNSNKLIINKVNKIITNSKKFKTLIESKSNIKTSLCCMTDTRDNNLFIQYENKTSLSRIFLYIGRLVPEKLLDIMILAFNNFNKDGKYKLILAGTGSEYENLRRLISINAINHVEIRNYWHSYNDIKELMLSADYIVLPSCSEGLPASTIEALKMGIPSIVSNAYGIRELIQNNYTGFVFYLANYDMIMENGSKIHWSFDEVVPLINQYRTENINSLTKTFESIPIDLTSYNILRNNCISKYHLLFNEDINVMNIFDLEEYSRFMW